MACDFKGALTTSAARDRSFLKKLAIHCLSLSNLDRVESTRSSICAAETLSLDAVEPGAVRPAPSDVM